MKKLVLASVAIASQILFWHAVPAWSQTAQTTALYRLYNPRNGDHLYSIDATESATAIANSGYKSEGVAAYVFGASQPGSVPLYRLYNSVSGDHFYTTDAAEQARAIAQSGYNNEGIAAYVFSAPQPGSVPLYRLYNSQSKDHFYTIDVAENAKAIAQSGYKSEGIAAYVFATQQSATAPLYRLFNSTNGDHFYTTLACENDAAIEKSGYKSEGSAAYVFPATPLGPVARDESPETANGTVSSGPSTAGLIKAVAGDATALYAVSLNAGVWKSSANGAWTQLSNSPRWAYSIDIDPNNSSHIAVGERRSDYIGPQENQSGLWESFDAGANWSHTFDPTSSNGCNSREIPAVAFSKTSTLFIGTACGIGRRSANAQTFNFSLAPTGLGAIGAFSVSESKIWARTQTQLLFSSTDGQTWTIRSMPPPIGNVTISFPSAGDAFSLGAFDSFAYMACCSDPTPPCGNLNRLLIYDVSADAWRLQPNLVDDKGNPLLGCDGTGLGGQRFVRTFSLNRSDLSNVVGQKLQLFFGAAQEVYQATSSNSDGTIASWTKTVESSAGGAANPDPVHSDLWSFLLSSDGKTEWLSCDGGVYSKSLDSSSGWTTRISGLHTQHIHTLTTLLTSGGASRLAYPTSDNDAWFGNPANWNVESSLGDVNWTAGDSANPSAALLVRRTGLACNPHQAVALVTGFGSKLPSGSPLQDVQLNDDPAFDGPTFFHFIQSLTGETPTGFRLDAVMLSKLPLQYSDQNTCQLHNVSGALGKPDPNGTQNLVILRNQDYVATPDINASKGQGWDIAANNLPVGTQAFWVSGGHTKPTYYVLAVQSGQTKLFKGEGLQPPNLTQWQELNVQGNVLQPAPYPASGILTGGLNGPVFVNPYDSTQIYVLTSTGVRVSFTGGFSFQRDDELTSLLTAGGQFPLVGAFGGGNGSNIQIASRANSMSTLSDIAFDRYNPKVAVAGSPFTGVFYKGDSGKWVSLTSFLPKPFTPVSAVGIDCQGINVATEGRGVIRIVGYQGATN